MKRVGNYLYELCITGEWICIGRFVQIYGEGTNERFTPYL